MAKPLKVLIGIVGGTLALIVVALLALWLTFDANDHRDRIAAAVEKQTGRSFAVGDIRLSIFPWLKLELGQVTLGNAPGFGPEPMLRAEHIEVGVKLLPLLRERRIEASAIAIERASLRLAVNAEGVGNWDDLLSKPAAPAAGAVPTLEQRLDSLDVAGLALSEVQIDYDDRQRAQHVELTNVSLKTGRLHGKEPLDVEARLTALAGDPQITAKIEWQSRLRFDAASGDVSLEAPKLKLDARRAGARPLLLQVTAATEGVAYRKAAGTVQTSAPLVVDIEQLTLGDAAQPKLTMKGKLAASVLADPRKRSHRLEGLEAKLDLAGTSLPGGKPQPLVISSGLLLSDLAAGQVELSPMQASFAGLDVLAKQWRVSGVAGGTPLLQGDIAVAAFDPRALLKRLGIASPATADPNALKSATFTADLRVDARSARFGKLQLKLDDSSAQGEVAITDFAMQSMELALAIDRLDADRYLPAVPKPAVGASATPAAKQDMNARPLLIDAIDRLGIEGSVDIGALKARNLKLAKVRMKLDGKPGRTHRQQLVAQLYGGSVDAALGTAPGARQSLTLRLQGVAMQPLLKDLIDSDKLSGRGSVTLDVTSTGRTLGAARRSLDGKLAFDLADGAVKGFNLGKLLRDGQALLAQQPLATSAAQSTDFAELRGSGVISNGVLRSDDLSAKNPLLRLEGAGEVNFADETIDYLAKPMLVNTAGGQGGKERVNLDGLIVPMRIKGDLYRPKVSIDWQAALKQKAVEQLRENLGIGKGTVREQREALREKAKEEITKGLLKLFGGKKPPAEEPPAPPPP